MKKHDILLFSLVMEAAIIVAVSLANWFGNMAFYIFYNLIYGLLLSTAVPAYLVIKNKETLASVGVKKLHFKQYLIIIACVAFSIGGQLFSLDIIKIRFYLLPIGVVPLIMTTFFEEFLFRGFLQTRIERRYGWIPAVLLSGFLFSAYHLGYPGFRNIKELLILFAVGLFFALTYKLSENNIIVSYFINLPNAFLTYVLKSEHFPEFNVTSTVVSVITCLLIPVIILIILHVMNRQKGNLVRTPQSK